MAQSVSRVAARARPAKDRNTVYEEITNKIIAELEAGRLPWVQPWGSSGLRAPLGMPKNADGAQRREETERCDRDKRNRPPSRRQHGNQQGHGCSTRECCCRRKGGLNRPGSRDFRDSKLVARMGAQGIFGHQLSGNLRGKVAIEATLDVDARQLRELRGGILPQLFALAAQIGFLGVGLRADRHVLAGGHRHGPSYQSRDAGDQYGA